MAKDQNGGWAARRLGRAALAGAAAIACVSVAYALLRDDDRGDSPSVAMEDGAQTPMNAEEMLRGLQERVGADPEDVEGWQMLGFAYFELGRHADAARAYRRATELKPDNAVFWSSLGEALVMQSEQDPMPADAVSAFERAVSLDPKDPRARYFLGVRKDLGGDHEGAIADWLKLLGDTPPGAPWDADLRRTIEQVGKINKIEVADRVAAVRPAVSGSNAMGSADPHAGLAGGSVAAQAIPGPTREQMQAASALPPGQQQMMVDGMIAGLEAKLQDNPKNIGGWIMLMRSRMTLGEGVKAKDAFTRAIAANPAQAQRLKDEARILGVPGT